MEDQLAKRLSEAILSQTSTTTGRSSVTKYTGQSVPIQFDQRIPGTPSTVRAIALSEIRAGDKGSVALIRLSRPINGHEWAATTVKPRARTGSQRQEQISEIPNPITGKVEIEFELMIAFTGKRVD